MLPRLKCSGGAVYTAHTLLRLCSVYYRCTATRRKYICSVIVYCLCSIYCTPLHLCCTSVLVSVHWSFLASISSFLDYMCLFACMSDNKPSGIHFSKQGNKKLINIFTAFSIVVYHGASVVAILRDVVENARDFYSMFGAGKQGLVRPGRSRRNQGTLQRSFSHSVNI